MKKSTFMILGVLILLVLVVYPVAYQVRFNEMAVVTTFGKTDESSVKNADGKSPGLYWRWPWPIQEVHKFDARVRVIDDRLEQQDTRDKQVVILQAFVTWRIADPLAFYRSLRNEVMAERFLRDRLRTARAEIGNFDFDDLTNVDPAQLKLAHAEQAILNRMKAELADQATGVQLETVGIKRIVLPEEITKSVFKRMRTTRQRLAQKARSEGEALAKSIRAQATSDEERILAFADRKAREIRAEGDQAAAEYYKSFAQNEDFAVFIRKMEALEATLSNNTTFLLDTHIAPFDLLEPDKQTQSPKDEKSTAPKN